MTKLLSPQELSAALNISIETVYAWTSQKRIPYIKMGRLVRFNADEVNKWLERQKIRVVGDI
ncbi:MAG: helix-turn-helix domain-containing protein [Candidatus Omnitrophica bacterium]|nr:helix-turn-helix domain-containing protein [Candidatus Omnitrophota bacterium]